MKKNKSREFMGKIISVSLSAFLLIAPTSGFAVGKSFLTLQDSIQIAILQNEELKGASEDINAAKWHLKETKGEWKPKVDFSHTSAEIGGSYWQVFHIDNVPSSYFVNAVTLSLPIYNGGRKESNIDYSETGIDISNLAFERTKENLKYQVSKAYYMILACQNFEEAKNDAVNQLKDHLYQVNEQFSVGTVAKADVLRSEVALANAQQELVTAKNNTKIAKASFNKLLGNSVKDKVELSDTNLDVKDEIIDSLDGYMDYAIKNRKDYLASQKSIKQAEAEVKIAESGKCPNVSLTASYGTYDTKITEFDTKQWLAGINVNLNLFDGNVTEAKEKEAQAKLAKAKHHLQDQKEVVEFEVQQAYLNMQKSASNILTNKVAVDKAREDFKLARARYDANVGTNLDVVDAQVALTNAKTAYIESVYDYRVNTVALKYAVGSI